MARTHGKIKIEVWDVGSDFRELSVDAQWAYEMLVSQPGLTMCGVLAYTPKKWAKLARGLTIERLEVGVAELERGWYVIVDRESDELLIRTFIRHDEPWKLPNLVKAARRQLREVDSPAIREYLAERHEWLVEPMAEEMDSKEWAKAIASIRAYEIRRASERTSERTLPLPLERASEWPRTRVGGRTPPATATTTATTTAPAEQEVLTADRSETTAPDLPFEKERLTVSILAAVGSDADEGTPNVIRHYAAMLPEGSLAKVLEGVQSGRARDRAAYAVSSLAGEVEQNRVALNGAEPETDFAEPEP